MYKKIKTLFISFMLVVQWQAHAALEIVITEGVDGARPIAIVPFKYEGNGVLPMQPADVIAADLMRSGKFKPISVADMPE
jgi:TolB protein